METGARAFSVSDYPAYIEAVARENFIRGSACLGFNENILGYEVKPLTAYHIRWLALVKSPFLVGAPLDALCEKPGILNDILNFLWIVSPMFKPGSLTSKSNWRFRDTQRDKFNKAFSGIMSRKVDEVCQAILDYIEGTYIDADDSGTGGDDKSYFAFEVGIAHELNHHYGLPINFWENHKENWLQRLLGLNRNLPSPIHVPLKIIFQLRKFRAKWEDPKAIVTNRSEHHLRDALTEINREQRKQMRYEEYVKELNQEKPPLCSDSLNCDVDYSSN